MDNVKIPGLVMRGGYFAGREKKGRGVEIERGVGKKKDVAPPIEPAKFVLKQREEGPGRREDIDDAIEKERTNK